MMMIILTLIGIASTYTSIFEIKLSGNKRASTDAFYTAEGGIESVLSNLTNFNVSTGSTLTSIPTDPPNESIKLRTVATPSLPSGVNFAVTPLVTIYETTRTNAPRGLGFSATGNIEYAHFIVDSIGKDQIGGNLSPSNSQVREKVVRLIPTSQGGN
jgi:hypothetical protein